MENLNNINVNIDTFYNGSTIFITGGTGFLGKVIIEKLLRLFDIKKLYLLIRIKDNKSIEDRLKSILNEPIFDKLRDESPESLKKVIAIKADFDIIDLGISNENKMILSKNVEIVFNIVASVKFNEKLRDAFEINVLGTKKIIDLVMDMKNLKSFIHISTLYSNCNRKFIAEKVYEQDIGYEKIIQMARILKDNDLNKMQHCLVDDFPNTYTMTKKCAENLVNHKAHLLPAGIFRPPIVLSTYKEPLPGWTDNLYGPAGLCAWTARGFIHCIYGNSKIKANLVPADYCANAILAVAWDISNRYKQRIFYHKEMPVYNYIYDSNNLTWGKYMKLARSGQQESLENAIWYYSYLIIPWKTYYYVAESLCHTLPGYIFDFIALLTGQKRIYSKAYSKMGRVIMMMSYFGLREWKFQNDNIQQLSSLLYNSDKRDTLQFDMSTIDWNEYFLNYIAGIKKFFYKEQVDEKILQKNKCHYRRLFILHLLLKASFAILLCTSSFKLIGKFLYKILFKITI